MGKLLILVLCAVSVIYAKNCITSKSPFPFNELKHSNHSNRVSSTLQAVFNRRGVNFTLVEGYSCRNATGNVYWYHVILDGDTTRSEVSFVEATNGSKRGRIDYLVLEPGKTHYSYRWKIASIK
ncbi:uncharacterized protein LOC131683973 [Topomyia yanbarensis]|uniref:uncharacterized protein LOC131683973 n=1 Tax=Topomyia yanbarensis TaxID=2498891 RepID=UPI00273AC713|nr:uncharacterized protein LOC131683973 [Topomyia yanbarensis]